MVASLSLDGLEKRRLALVCRSIFHWRGARRRAEAVFRAGGIVIALIESDRSLAILVRLRYGANAAMHSKELWGSKFLSVVSGEGCLSSGRHGEGGQ